MNRRIAVMIGILALAALLAACGGGDGNGDADEAERATTEATHTPQTDEDSEGIDALTPQDVAEEALLRLEDFPTGWVERRAEEEEEAPELDLPPQCKIFVERESAPGTVAETDSPEFHGPYDEEVTSGVTVFEDADAAHQTFAEMADFLEDCRDPLRDAMIPFLQEMFETEFEEDVVQGVEVTEYNIDRLAFPSLGDESMALRINARMTVTVGTPPFPYETRMYTDIIAVRVDRIVGSLDYTEVMDMPDTYDEERLAEIIEERLRSAAAALGG